MGIPIDLKFIWHIHNVNYVYHHLEFLFNFYSINVCSWNFMYKKQAYFNVLAKILIFESSKNSMYRRAFDLTSKRCSIFKFLTNRVASTSTSDWCRKKVLYIQSGANYYC